MITSPNSKVPEEVSAGESEIIGIEPFSLSLKEKLVKYHLYGASFPWLLMHSCVEKRGFKSHTNKKRLANTLLFCAILSTQIMFFSAIFAGTFCVGKLALGKTNKQVALIGGTASGIGVVSLLLFALVDSLLHLIGLRKRSDLAENVTSDLIYIEGALTCGVPTLLGFAQVKLYESCMGQYLELGIIL